MTDDQESSHRSTMTLSAIAELVGGRVEGDPDLRVGALRPIEEAGPGELGLLAARRYVRFVRSSRAGAMLVSEELEGDVPEGRAHVVVPNVHGVLPALLARLHPPAPEPGPGIHPTAVLGIGVHLGAHVSIGPYVVLGDGAEVGDRSRIDAHAVIGDRVRVGADCHIYPHVVVYPGTSIGERVLVHAGAKLGSDGFGYTYVDGAHRKVPQVGGCIIGDDVEIGANTTVDRGSVGDTVLEKGVKLDNLVQIAHNVKLGAHSLLAALVGIAGSTRIGKGVFLGGQAGVIGHLEIGDGAKIAIASKVLRDVEARETVSGYPARPHREDLRRLAHLGRLPKLLERIEKLELEIARIAEAVRASDDEKGDS